MKPFIPDRVFFQEDALDYPLGQDLWTKFREMKLPVEKIKSLRQVSRPAGQSPARIYREAKSTLIVGVRKTLDFASCRPSAHYQLPLASSCPGKCEYCYLQTTLGKRPYPHIYVNQEEILKKAAQYIEEKKPSLTVFEGAATSDPLPLEPYSGALAKTIEFFAGQPYGRFRFVTKFTEVAPLLNIHHENHTRFRFSLNNPRIIASYEHGTPPLAERLTAAGKVSRAGYPLGFIIAPLFYYPGWQEDYGKLLDSLKEQLDPASLKGLTFELITHRYTKRAKENILSLYPESSLPMIEEERQLKFGQFGYTKYLYPEKARGEMKNFFSATITSLFPEAEIAYFI